MERTMLSRITCAVDSELSPLVLGVLEDLKIPEVFVQGGKQLSLTERSGPLGFWEKIALTEDRADIFRFCVPEEFESGIADRVAEAADLRLPGRGCLYAEPVEVIRSLPLSFDRERLAALAAGGIISCEPYTVICCIVQRGLGEAIARTVLEMGLCVPIVSFGEGMGLRNKLGLLRVTVPVDKEVMYFLVPERDAGLLSGIIVHKARLDRPGQGFLYRYRVRASAVNVRTRKSSKRHAATFDQVIAALDSIRGSTDWRRQAMPASTGNQTPADNTPESACLSLLCDAGRAQDFVRAAMDAGAGGATLLSLTWHGFAEEDDHTVSHARETCDLVIRDSLVDPVLETIGYSGLFSEDAYGAAELSRVRFTVTYRN